MMVGRIWKAKTKPSAAVPLASPALNRELAAALDAERAEHELGADEGEVEQAGDPRADPGEELLPDRDLEHEEGERELEAQAPEDRPEPYGLAVRGEGPGDPQEHEQAEEREESFHVFAEPPRKTG